VTPSDEEAENYIRRKIERLPLWLGGRIRRLRQGGRFWLRLSTAFLLIVGGLLWFLPILGLWMLPLGMFILADEIPPLKRWLAGMAIRAERWWNRLRRGE
jgi:hypothetical protein